MCLLSVAEALRSLQPTNRNAPKSSLSCLPLSAVCSACLSGVQSECLSAADGGRLEQCPPSALGGRGVMGKKLVVVHFSAWLFLLSSIILLNEPTVWLLMLRELFLHPRRSYGGFSSPWTSVRLLCSTKVSLNGQLFQREIGPVPYSAASRGSGNAHADADAHNNGHNKTLFRGSRWRMFSSSGEFMTVCLRAAFYWHFAPICTKIALWTAASTNCSLPLPRLGT